MDACSLLISGVGSVDFVACACTYSHYDSLNYFRKNLNTCFVKI